MLLLSVFGLLSVPQKVAAEQASTMLIHESSEFDDSDYDGADFM